MESKVYLLYVGNAWLSNSSLQLIAVCTTEAKAIELATAHAKDGEEPLDEDSIQELEMYSQTNGRDENYLICQCNLDELEG
ncbi:MAG: hypothetical protein NC548_46695 [Lachnospiraceae bacterium]|nr:hypothetical protein [Lachnospiraceae bacterium]